MKILGVITEYNPFHNGHAYHIQTAKSRFSCDGVVAVMSGHFVQRGEPALYDKWTRAKFALLGGVDLVLELPTVFATSSAEYFAFGALDVLQATGSIDTLCFGSESGCIDALTKIATHIPNSFDPRIDELIKPLLASGMAYPAAYSQSQRLLLEKEGLTPLHGPNNHLGLEYIRSANRLNSSIKIETIKRIGSDYHGTLPTGQLSSATALRQLISSHETSKLNHYMPESICHQLKEIPYKPVFPESMLPFLRQAFMMTPPDSLSKIHDMEPGLPQRMKQAALCSTNYNQFMNAIQTKRYTTSRLRRIMIKTLLHIESEQLGRCGDLRVSYIRPLAFNETGKNILSKMKSNTRVPILTRLNRLKDLQLENDYLLQKDIAATQLYSLLRGSALCGDADFTRPPVMF